MNPRTKFILVALALLLLANWLMLSGFTNYPYDAESFMNYAAANAAPAGAGYKPIGAYDGIMTKDETTPVVAAGPEFQVGQDALYMFKDNECKPECCGSSYSCGAGCVCVTDAQRAMLMSRGGNRTKPVDL
jgi:hypothetical protein